MSDELKPCPFCGEQEKIQIRDTGEGHTVDCKNCFSSGPFSYNNPLTNKEAVTAWNRRA